MYIGACTQVPMVFSTVNHGEHMPCGACAFCATPAFSNKNTKNNTCKYYYY